MKRYKRKFDEGTNFTKKRTNDLVRELSDFYYALFNSDIEEDAMKTSDIALKKIKEIYEASKEEGYIK